MAVITYAYVCIFFTCIYGQDTPVVKTPLGSIAGVFETSYNGRKFSSFYGVPYAKPPIGEFRFEEPQPIVPWSGTWKATTKTHSCAQINHAPIPEGGIYEGDEDCLYLNVFVPHTNPQEEQSLDVVVHIHGGAFMFASMNTYAGPKFLMDRDVVLVTLNYRLGILGFLSTGDDVVPGNNGMKDQSMALRWIKDNIRYFGGNPKSVTLTGLSAGGASVHYHYMSPLSKGLFNKGISASGNALNMRTIQKQPLERAKLIGSYLGCYENDSKQLIKCLKERSVRQIVEITRLLRPWLFNPYSPLALTLEKANEKAFLSEHPYVLLSNGKIQDLPWMVSLTSEEGLYPGAEFALDDKYLTNLENRWNELAPHILHYNFSVLPELKDNVSRRLKQEYFQDRPISNQTYMTLINMLSDGLFALTAEKAAKLQATVSKSDIYFYYFSYPGEAMESFSVYFSGRDQNYGVCHGDDMMYLFSNPQNLNIKLKKSDEEMKDVFLDFWTSFIKSGVPSVREVNWSPVAKSNESFEFLHIKSPRKMFMDPVDKIDRHRKFWESLPFMERRLFSNTERDEL